MINVGTYVKILLNKRNMTQAELLRKMNNMDLGNGTVLSRQHLNNFINGIGNCQSFTWARRVEIALELPEYSLIKMIGRPTDYEWAKIKEIGNKGKTISN